MPRMTIHCLCALALLTSLIPSAQAERHPLLDIRQAAQEFAMQAARDDGHEQVTVSTGQLDNRLRLAPCEAPLERFHPPGGRVLGSTTVGVRCTAPNPWTLYVPVQVAVEAEVLVLAANLPRDHTIQSSDLRLRATDIATMTRGYFQDDQEIIGHRTRRSAQAGTVVTPDLLEIPLLVRRGQQVSIEGGSGAVRVHANGKALADGSMGDVIRVENSTSGKELDARVIGEATVRIR